MLSFLLFDSCDSLSQKNIAKLYAYQVAFRETEDSCNAERDCLITYRAGAVGTIGPELLLWFSRLLDYTIL